MRKILVLLFAVLAIGITIPVHADTVYWTDWTSALTNQVNGTLTLPGGTVNVTYTGEILFTQTAGGTDYWTGNAYTNNSVNYRPTGTDLIAITGGYQVTNTITFSQPVLNPMMAIVSLGQPSLLVQYQFDSFFDIFSVGYGYWGGGPNSLWKTATNVLNGAEGHGLIQFAGPVSSISWTVPQYENWHGFTIGAPNTAPVPVPAPILLLGSGLLGLPLIRRRFRKN